MIRAISFMNLCCCLTGFKLLFLKSYVSTDFDVHRNWMAITYNLPMREWYSDETSEWTLDYPPLFAAFEFLLAAIAHLFNLKTTLELSKHGIRDAPTVIYQKTSVIISDFVYYYAVYNLCRSLSYSTNRMTTAGKSDGGPRDNESSKKDSQSLIDAFIRPDRESGIALLLLLQPGLLMIDHIHFQYNGLLSGILLLAISDVVNGKYVSGSFWFATLLNMKHIYLYCAPAFGLYLLTSHCLVRGELISFIKRTSQLGTTVLLVFCIAFAPFADLNILKQILVRLFPFKRGLTHAYWAPNLWSIYNTVDKFLAYLFRSSLSARFDLDSISSKSNSASSTSGLVQEYKHQYLPTITPLTTLLLVVILTLPIIIKFLFNVKREAPGLFIRGVIVSSFTAFIFGWHVHEKAIIVVLLPLIPVAFRNPKLSRIFIRLTLAGTYSLFPLLFQPAEMIVRATILTSYYTYAKSISNTTRQTGDQQGPTRKSNQSIRSRIYSMFDTLFVIFIFLLEFYNTILHGKFDYSWNPIAKLNRYNFLPLMLTSNLSAIGITVSYLELYLDFMYFSPSDDGRFS